MTSFAFALRSLDCSAVRIWYVVHQRGAWIRTGDCKAFVGLGGLRFCLTALGFRFSLVSCAVSKSVWAITLTSRFLIWNWDEMMVYLEQSRYTRYACSDPKCTCDVCEQMYSFAWAPESLPFPSSNLHCDVACNVLSVGALHTHRAGQFRVGYWVACKRCIRKT